MRRTAAAALAALAALATRAAGERYIYLDYANVTARLSALAAAHPALVTLQSAQARFGLPFVGDCGVRNGSAGGGGDGCATWIVTLTEHTTLADDPGRAEVLVSGELHGDEVVGVHAVLAYLEMVVAKVEAGDAYFRKMVRERVVVALPMANAVGYYRGERGERQGEAVVDPNRDFAFDQEPGKCMQTVAARAINEIVREGLFRVLITFHGGTNALGYEWGDMQHCQGRLCRPAPDERFMRRLGERMSAVAGGGAYEREYPVGTMGKLVYPVHGGMEDWAYGASWSGQAVQCRPETLGGYPAEKTVYGKGSNRCVTYLVETAMQKRPPEETLGDDRELLVTGGGGDGHVPRNVRLLVAAVDGVEPYIIIVNATSSSADGGRVSVYWSAGGAFTVGGTHLEWSDSEGMVHGTSAVYNGTAAVSVLQGNGMATVFLAYIPQLPAAGGGGLYFRVAAVVDAELGVAPDGAAPDLPPQTHIVGARVDPAWFYASGEKRVRGRRVVYSSTVRAALPAGEARVKFSKEDGLTDWAKAGLRAPRAEDVSALLRGAGEESIQDGGDGVGNLVMDPRDREAIVSGIVGVAMILCVTGTVVVAMWRHYRKRRDEKETVFTISEEEELKEPLHGEVDEEDPATVVAQA